MRPPISRVLTLAIGGWITALVTGCSPSQHAAAPRPDPGPMHEPLLAVAPQADPGPAPQQGATNECRIELRCLALIRARTAYAVEVTFDLHNETGRELKLSRSDLTMAASRASLADSAGQPWTLTPPYLVYICPGPEFSERTESIAPHSSRRFTTQLLGDYLLLPGSSVEPPGRVLPQPQPPPELAYTIDRRPLQLPSYPVRSDRVVGGWEYFSDDPSNAVWCEGQGTVRVRLQ
jgi:hypothetical protein